MKSVSVPSRSIPATSSCTNLRGLLSPVRAALLTIILGLATFLSAAASHAATLVTDKDDYAPGETAYFVGTGFWAGEAVAITLAVHTQDGTVLDYAIGGVYADSEGSIAATWLVPQEAADTWIEATAIGDQSALVAGASFTDTVSSANVTLPTSSSPVTVSSLPATITVTFTYSSSGANGTTASVVVPGVASNSKSVATGGTAASPLQESLDVTIPSGTPNGSYNVHLTVGNSSTPGPTTRNDNHAGAIIVNVPTVEPEPTCPENSAPIISASDYVLTDVCATWNGSGLTVTVPVEPANFDPQTEDPDGDPVSVSLDVSEVTLTGLGEVEVTVTLTATDDPNGRNVAGCPDLVAMSTNTTAKVKASLTFNFAGFGSPLSPVDNPSVRKVKNGSTVAVKFRLYDCNGTEICSTPTPNWIWVGLQTEYAPDGGVEVDDSGAANDNGDSFRYSGACGVDGNWIYNLSTKTGYTAGTTYKITAVLADGTTHDALICINK